MTGLFVDPRGRPVQTAQTAHSYNQKHAHNKPMGVLKILMQNEAYMKHIQ